MGDEIKNAIISVPVTFNDAQRQATHIAASITGFNQVKIYNDATAAVQANGFSKAESQIFLTVDISANALKVDVLELSQGVIDNIVNMTIREQGG